MPNNLFMIKMRELLIVGSEIINIDAGPGTRIKLLEASIPITFDNVSAANFQHTGSISGPHAIALPGSRYTLQTLVDTLQSLFTFPGQTYVVAASASGEIIISSSTETLELNFPAPAIGFSGAYPPASSHTGSSIVSELQKSHLLVCSAQIRGIDNGIKITSNPGLTGVLHAVPLCASGVANYRASKSSPWIFITQPITSFFLAFADGFPVNLNGATVSFKILVD